MMDNIQKTTVFPDKTDDFFDDEFLIEAAPSDFQYTIIPNALARDRRLSITDRGLLLHLLSLPPKLKVKKKSLHLEIGGPDGRDKIMRAFDNLIKAGYVLAVRKRSGSGQFSGNKYYVYNSPRTGNPATVNCSSQLPDNQPRPGNPALGNPSLKEKGEEKEEKEKEKGEERESTKEKEYQKEKEKKEKEEQKEKSWREKNFSSASLFENLPENQEQINPSIPLNAEAERSEASGSTPPPSSAPPPPQRKPKKTAEETETFRLVKEYFLSLPGRHDYYWLAKDSRSVYDLLRILRYKIWCKETGNTSADGQRPPAEYQVPDDMMLHWVRMFFTKMREKYHTKSLSFIVSQYNDISQEIRRDKEFGPPSKNNNWQQQPARPEKLVAQDIPVR